MHAAVRIAALPIVFAIAALAHPALEFALRDTEGVEHHQNEWAQARAVVLFFVTTDCPLSNGYAPEMNRIEQAYAAARCAGASAANSVLPSRKSPCTIVAGPDSGRFSPSQRPTLSTAGVSRVLLSSHRPAKRRSWRSR